MAVKITQEMINGAKATELKYGVPASVTLAQIIQESGGNYEGGLSGLAYNYNNLFGIKAGSSWNGRSVALQTTEYQNGTPYKTTANFRVYDSISDSIDDHGALLTKPIYTNQTNSATNLTEYVQKMGSVYATDPNYANSLMKIINDNNLTQYDSGVLPHYVNNNTQSGSATVTETGWLESKWHSVLTMIVKILAIAFFVIMAVVFFMGAFDIKVPTKKNIKNTVTKKVKDKVEETTEQE